MIEAEEYLKSREFGSVEIRGFGSEGTRMEELRGIVKERERM